MYIIIEWNMSVINANIVQELDGDEAAGNAVFETEAAAVDFAETNCAFLWRVVKM